MPDKDGTRHKYLGLLDTGSTHSLLLEDIVSKHGLEIKRDNGKWTTNTGDFQTRKLAIATKIGLPQFSRKRTIASADLSLNLNNGQKYKAIFGMDFLLTNGMAKATASDIQLTFLLHSGLVLGHFSPYFN